MRQIIFYCQNSWYPDKNRSSASPLVSLETTRWGPKRIWDLICPQYSLACCERLNGVGFFYETGNTVTLFYSRCGILKISPSSKALSAEHRPNHWQVKVTSSYERKILKWHTRKTVDNQSINQSICLFIYILSPNATCTHGFQSMTILCSGFNKKKIQII
jgi:hypothetical protein